MAPRSLRTWWIWTVIGNVTGSAILLTGRATNSSTLVALGFVLVVSLGVQSAQTAGTPLKEQSQRSDRAHGEDSHAFAHVHHNRDRTIQATGRRGW